MENGITQSGQEMARQPDKSCSSPFAEAPKQGEIVARGFLFLGSLALSILLLEGGARIYLRLSPLKSPVGRWEFRSTRPAPYQHADYFNDRFLSESARCVTGLTVSPSNHFVLLGDFAGRYFNVSKGLRRTTDQPARYAHRVLLFGGSTIFCQEVPDNQTIASHLQRLIKRKAFRVENYGVVSMSATQQTARLLGTPVLHGDTVIFYDGVNDIYYPVFNGNPRGWVLGEGHDGGVRKLNWVQRMLFPFALRYQNPSACARLFLQGIERQPRHNISDLRIMKENLEVAQRGYEAALVKAHNYVVRKGGRFVHCFQPTIFTLARPSSYEKRLIENENMIYPGLDSAFRIGYPRLRTVLEAANRKGVISFDLSGVLDERAPGEEFYLDYFHVNHTANERIARKIYDLAFGS